MAKRSRQDRRCWSGRTKFPLHDSSGEFVREDRRRLPDRRLSGIEVEWLEMVYESGREAELLPSDWNPREGQGVSRVPEQH